MCVVVGVREGVLLHVTLTINCWVRKREKHKHYNCILHIANQPEYSRPTYRLYISVHNSPHYILHLLYTHHPPLSTRAWSSCLYAWCLWTYPQPCRKQAIIMTLWVASFNGYHPQYPTGWTSFSLHFDQLFQDSSGAKSFRHRCTCRQMNHTLHQHNNCYTLWPIRP